MTKDAATSVLFTSGTVEKDKITPIYQIWSNISLDDHLVFPNEAKSALEVRLKRCL